jgi:hypothetical protein
MGRFFRNNPRTSKRNLFFFSGLAWFIVSSFLLIKGLYNLFSDDEAFLFELFLSVFTGITLFYVLFKKIIGLHINRILQIQTDNPHLLSILDFKGYLVLFVMTILTFTIEYDELIDLNFLFVFQLTMSIPIFLCSIVFFRYWRRYEESGQKQPE